MSSINTNLNDRPFDITNKSIWSPTPEEEERFKNLDEERAKKNLIESTCPILNKAKYESAQKMLMNEQSENESQIEKKKKHILNANAEPFTNIYYPTASYVQYTSQYGTRYYTYNARNPYSVDTAVKPYDYQFVPQQFTGPIQNRNCY